VVKPK